MFSSELHRIEAHVSSFLGKRPTVGELDDILTSANAGKQLALDQIWSLLNIDVKNQRDQFEVVLDLSQSRKQQVYGGRVFAIVPLYATSICQEHCVYCNYRATNKSTEVERLRLNNAQLDQEARFLVGDKDLRVIELVYATDPFVRVQQIGEQIELVESLLVETGGGMVGINAEPFDTSEYCELNRRGLDFVVLWQETYQREIYRHLHPGGTKKSNFDYRVDAFERMMEAGIRYFGCGVLSGLAPWRLDWLLLIAHEMYLAETYGNKPSILGIPRLKNAPGAALHSTPFIPTDDEFLLAIAVHNIMFPESLPFVNTRESWELCVKVTRGGGVLFTFDCKTIPGGYTLGSVGCQFPTFSYDSRIYRRRIEQEHLTPVFDWDFAGIGYSKSGVE